MWKRDRQRDSYSQKPVDNYLFLCIRQTKVCFLKELWIKLMEKEKNHTQLSTKKVDNLSKKWITLCYLAESPICRK